MKKGGKWKAFRTPIPSSLYVDVVIRPDVLAIWKDTSVPQLMGCNRVADAIANVSKCLCSKAKQDRYQLKTKVLSTKRAVISLQHFQQRMPWVTWVMSELNNTMDKLSNYKMLGLSALIIHLLQSGHKRGIKSLLIFSKL